MNRLAESEVLHSAPPSPPEEGGGKGGGGKGAAWLLLPSHLPSLPLSLFWSPVAISLALAIALVAGNVPGFGNLGQPGAGQLLAPKSLGVGITLLYASVLRRHGRVQAARLWVAGGVRPAAASWPSCCAERLFTLWTRVCIRSHTSSSWSSCSAR